MERSKRSKGSHILFKSIVSSSEIKQWKIFLSSNKNKNALVRFIVAEWKKENYRLSIGSKSIFVTDGEKVFKINEDTVIAIPESESNHDGADTRMMLHAQHASQHFQKILISIPETNVFIICLSFQPVTDTNLYFITGIKSTAVVENINQNLNVCESPKESLLSAFVRFHSFTGCDTLSAFAGRGKIKPLMLMMKSKDYIEMFESFGSGIEIDDSLINLLNRFLCHI